MAKQQIVLDVKPRLQPKKKPRGNPDKIKGHMWKPGQSGNPTGRPKGTGSKIISIAYSAALEQELPEDVKVALQLDGKVTWADAIALQMVKRAVEIPNSRIDMGAVQELREVTEGKLPEKQEVAGAGGTPLQAPTFSVQLVKPTAEVKDAGSNE